MEFTKKGEKVFPHDLVLVEYTDKAKQNKPGKKSTIHPVLAAKLVKKGVVKIISKGNVQEKAANEDGIDVSSGGKATTEGLKLQKDAEEGKGMFAEKATVIDTDNAIKSGRRNNEPPPVL